MESPLRRPAPQTEAVLRMTADVYDHIRLTIGRLPAEQGGILGGRPPSELISHYYFDRHAETSRGSYSPDHGRLNQLLARIWNPNGVRMLGFVHSQPRGCTWPSVYDIQYAQTILDHNPWLDQFYLPIVQSPIDGAPFGIYAYRVVRGVAGVEACQPMRLEVVPPDEPESCSLEDDEEPVGEGFRNVLAGGSLPRAGAVGDIFARLQDAVDLRRMALSRVIVVGVGGAASFVEDLARSGVGDFVLIDPDLVTETNLATQQVYLRDLGKSKVRQLARRLKQINPWIKVLPLARRLDELDDECFYRILVRPLRRWSVALADYWGISGLDIPANLTVQPRQSLLCGFTDDFFAQARINRLALQFGLPSLCAQLYAEGRGAEVTFTYPGITPACHRCILKMRYDAYLSGYRPEISSRGTPIFSTGRLNAIKGFIALALLHYGTNHPRWTRWLEQIAHRNLVQIRMDPQLDLPVFAKVLEGADHERLFCDEAVWLPQVPRAAHDDEPACPDCGGTGDLRDAIGRFADTRILPTL
ncbi:MAG: hypothetical protein KatS3mg110_0188 [Pirellulaceae bacterium]|nr:MAG: hypothetical protein KatS3mg110_0188 [Pirellulaceae bacterium]